MWYSLRMLFLISSIHPKLHLSAPQRTTVHYYAPLCTTLHHSAPLYTTQHYCAPLCTTVQTFLHSGANIFVGKSAVLHFQEGPAQGRTTELQKKTSGLWYKIYDVIFTPSYRSKEVSVESIHRCLLSSVRRRKYNVINL